MSIDLIDRSARRRLRTIAHAFDEGWYLNVYPEIRAAKIDPLSHYYEVGGFEGFFPNAIFDSRHYLEANPDVEAQRYNPLYHYLVFGAGEGRQPSGSVTFMPGDGQADRGAGSPLLDYLQANNLFCGGMKQRALSPLRRLFADRTRTALGDTHERYVLRARDQRAKSGFDAEYYAAQNNDVVASSMDLFDHYVRFGAQEGRDPNPLFEGRWYLDRNPDVVRLGMNPLVHYMIWGASELRDPSPDFSSREYVARNPTAFANPMLHRLRAARGASAQRAPLSRAIPEIVNTNSDSYLASLIFDRDFYLAKYPDIASAGIEPLAHYLAHGGFEGRRPNALFDGAYYTAMYPDVAATGMNPLLHYMRYGALELRDPSPNFDSVFYVEQNPDAANNPLLHYLLYGKPTARPTYPAEDPGVFTRKADGSGARIARGAEISIVVPVYRGLDETRACLDSLFADRQAAFGRLILVDDCSPEPDLSAYLRKVASRDRRITLLVNAVNLGFVRSVNRALAEAGEDDVVLLNSDTELPADWLSRLARHAYATDRVATVTPYSNNASLCGFPSVKGGPIPAGATLAQIDAAARAANDGIAVPVPVGVGFCMYIRRACLDAIGGLDAEAFGKGYGEEVDFCLRAAQAGWENRLACDLFVYHAGEVSFGKQSAHYASGQAALHARYPAFSGLISNYRRKDPGAPYRLRLAAALATVLDRDVVLHVTHNLGGGIARHIDDIARVTGRDALPIVAKPHQRGLALALVGHDDTPLIVLNDRSMPFGRAALAVLGLSFVHVHHLLGYNAHFVSLLKGTRLPVRFTIHDFLTVCPKINLLKTALSFYCGQPNEAGCNACLLAGGRDGARDIDTWRNQYGWLLADAAEVIAPSHDTRMRIARYAPEANIRVVSHDAFCPPAAARLATPRDAAGRPARPMRIGILGVLAEHKGLSRVLAALDLADAAEFAFLLVGEAEPHAGERLRTLPQTGPYEDRDLGALLHAHEIDVAWFPVRWPETYSYTLSAALAAGLPVVAADLGALPERLAGRAASLLVRHDADTPTWLEAFRRVGRTVRDAPPVARRPTHPETASGSAAYYRGAYLARPAGPKRTRVKHVLVVPEMLENRHISPCGYIRLVLPMLDIARGDPTIRVHVGTAGDLAEGAFDLVVTQRHAVLGDDLEELLDGVRRRGIALAYDLDDQLLDVPDFHPESRVLQPRATSVRRLVAASDATWASTAALASACRDHGGRAHVVENGLDGRLWLDGARTPPPDDRRLRVLYMGTATHRQDLDLIRDSVIEVGERFRGRVAFDLIGVTSDAQTPSGFERVVPPAACARAYPMFVEWFRRQQIWHLGVAPLRDDGFNSYKSSIKALDYLASGMPVLASDHMVYRGSVADGIGGRLVRNDPVAWTEALCHILEAATERAALLHAGEAILRRDYTLEAQRAGRATLMKALL